MLNTQLILIVTFNTEIYHEYLKYFSDWEGKLYCVYELSSVPSFAKQSLY